MEIRPTIPSDFESISHLIRQLMPWSDLDPAELLPVFKAALSAPHPVYLSAVEADEIIGFGSMAVRFCLWSGGPMAFVDELVVDARHRGRGIGSRLMEALILAARDRGCRHLELDTIRQRREACRFYRERGFENRADLFSLEL